ncbi:hypothetical protein RND71_040655 [Anisodus tanguticus]|uniref:Uncharacterized protein n=1 Tax=Anisodus tanguticus TaxID=243964 RepID=A0AAE1QTA0_9SOLA|nr:hypothetical protein RND71_040655 [Anisodus tanguticus]
MEKAIAYFLLGFLFISQYMVIIQSKIIYPPCQRGSCVGNQCKLPGDPYQYEWPELIGVEIIKAKATVERTNPYVTGVVQTTQCIVMGDNCVNRVWLCPDGQGNVRVTPKVG